MKVCAIVQTSTPSHVTAANCVTAHWFREASELKNAGILAMYTYDSNDPTNPWQPLVVRHPDSMTEVCLNDKRNKSNHKANVYAAKMGTREAFHISKTGNKSIVEIGHREGSLSSLQQEDEIGYTTFGLTSQNFRVISKPNLYISRVVSHLENCSYIRLDLVSGTREISRTSLAHICTQSTP